MFFKKKKEVLLRHGLLAEALMSLTVKDWYDLKEKQNNFMIIHGIIIQIYVWMNILDLN